MEFGAWCRDTGGDYSGRTCQFSNGYVELVNERVHVDIDNQRRTWDAHDPLFTNHGIEAQTEEGPILIRAQENTVTVEYL